MACHGEIIGPIELIINELRYDAYINAQILLITGRKDGNDINLLFTKLFMNNNFCIGVPLLTAISQTLSRFGLSIIKTKTAAAINET